MEIKTLPSKKGSVNHEVLVKQISDYLKVKPKNENGGHKNSN